MSAHEIQVFRILFHAMYLRQHRGQNVSLSPEALLEREEVWLNSEGENNPLGMQLPQEARQNELPSRQIMRMRAYIL